jgi:hypothetical protein
MKKIILPIAMLLATAVNGQGFVNGSFESTSSTGCDYNNGIAEFNSVMNNVVMYAGWETDIHQNGCYVSSIPDGIKAIGLASDDAINIELTEALISGEDYVLTFWKHANSYTATSGTIELGSTEDSGVAGISIGSAAPGAFDTWIEHSFTFTAPNNGTHISVANTVTGHWNQVDNFSIILACDALTTSVSATEICVGETVTLEASSDFGGTVTWDGGVVDGVAFEPPTGTTTYTATSDNPDDCQFSVDITVHELPIVTANVDDDEICLGQELTFTGGGAATYDWDMGVTNGLPFVPGDVGTETYTVVGTDANGCINTASVEATVHDIPEITGSVDDDEICLGESFVFTGSGGVTYDWSSGVEDGVPFTPGYAGTDAYYLVGIDANGCVYVDTVHATVHALPLVTATVDNDEICFGESVIFTGAGAESYDWDLGVTDGEAFTPLTDGTTTYTVTGTDDNGCENTAEVGVYVNPEITLTYTTIDETMDDGEIDITVTGGTPGYTFDWDTDEADDFDDMEDLTDLSAGFYTVVVRDANGCEKTEIIEIILLCMPLEIEVSDEVICETELLTLDATSESGADITWDGGVIDGVGFYPEMTGIITYTATSADPLDCPLVIEVEVLPAPTVNPTIGGETYCDGDVIVLGAGGDADSYSWDLMDLTPPVGVTTYTLTGTYDATGCSRSESIDVTVHALPTVNATADLETICVGHDIIFNGSGAMTYEWDAPEIIDGEPVLMLDEGVFIYTVVGTDENGCTNSDEIEITVTGEIEITYTVIDETIFEDGEIDITVTGGVAPYTFDWNTDESGDFDDDEDQTGLADALYNVIVQGSTGCSAEEKIIVGTVASLTELNNAQVSIYPNPTNNFITIEFEGEYSYELLSANGAVVLSGFANGNEKVEMSDLSDGVYFITIQAKETIQTLKVVKQ